MFRRSAQTLASRALEPCSPQVGDVVTVTLGGVTTECVVLRADGDGVTVVPLAPGVDFESIAEGSPVIAGVGIPAGATSQLVVTSTETVNALSGTLARARRRVTNQRQFYRIRLSFKIEASVDNGVTWQTCTGEDISQGGMLILNSEKVEVSVGQPVELRALLPGTEPIPAAGTVARVVHGSADESEPPARFAVKFTSISPEDARRLVQFIFQHQIEHAPYRFA